MAQPRMARKPRTLAPDPAGILAVLEGQEKPTGPEIIDKMQDPARVTLNRFMDRNPNTLTEADYTDLIRSEREKRALYINKGSKE